VTDARIAESAGAAALTISATTCLSAQRRWALGLAISLPLALISLRRPALRARAVGGGQYRADHSRPGAAGPVLPAFCSAWQHCRSACLGIGFFGAGPSCRPYLRWRCYSMLPVVRNTITGIQGIEPAIQGGPPLGVGMTERQMLRMVELPACPASHHGPAYARASVWVIGNSDAVDADRPDQSSATTSLPGCRPRTGYSSFSAA